MAFDNRHYEKCKIILKADMSLGHKITGQMLEDANRREDYEASKAIVEILNG
jgi:hypothetical protein